MSNQVFKPKNEIRKCEIVHAECNYQWKTRNSRRQNYWGRVVGRDTEYRTSGQFAQSRPNLYIRLGKASPMARASAPEAVSLSRHAKKTKRCARQIYRPIARTQPRFYPCQITYTWRRRHERRFSTTMPPYVISWWYE